MKKTTIIVMFLLAISLSGFAQQKQVKEGEVIHLNNEQFKKLVYNYEVNKEWKYLGNKPCIIDFYATWCGPCKIMSPRLDEIAREYAGKLIVYKVDTDQEQLLSGKLGIESLPTLVFVPKNEKPQASMGVIPKESLTKAVNEFLLIK